MSRFQWGVAMLVLTVPMFGQSTGEGVSAPTAAHGFSGQIYREIVDPNSGDRWLLLRNASHPGGPGRLVLQGSESSSGRVLAGSVSRAGPELSVAVAVIHNGDSLVVERDTVQVSERLEAIALGPAATGALFEVRLKIGGNVFRAVALGAGRAVFATTEGGRP